MQKDKFFRDYDSDSGDDFEAKDPDYPDNDFSALPELKVFPVLP